jgi:hypothetical protein
MEEAANGKRKMFEIAKEYKISMTDPAEPDSVNFYYGKAIMYEHPLLKIMDDERNRKTIKTSSPLFIEASPRH